MLQGGKAISYRFLNIHDAEFGEQEWIKVYALLSDLYAQNKLLLSSQSWEELKQRWLSHDSGSSLFERRVIFNDSEVIAYTDLLCRNQGTKNQFTYIHIETDANPAEEQYARFLTNMMYDWLDYCDVDHLICMTYDPNVHALFRSLGAETANRTNRYVLNRRDANHQQIAKWLKEMPAANPDLRLEFCETLPETHYDSVAKLVEVGLNDMPAESDNDHVEKVNPDDLRREDKWRSSNGFAPLKGLLYDKDKLIGFTALIISKRVPKHLYQMMTVIVTSYRGLGLSRWLKAGMFQHVGNLFPANERLITDMRAVNKPIQRVNEEMGYVLDATGYEFKLLRHPEETR